MPRKSTQGEFTGRHMLAVMVTGFGIVMAVNFFMAGLATSGFGGLIVDNTYVASQKFNTWLHEAERQRALGWEAQATRGKDGRLLVETAGVPEDAKVRAFLRRPLGELEPTEIELQQVNPTDFNSPEPLHPGRWIVRLEIDAAGQAWREEQQLP
ncbi:MAG TPA: FixH family protein [Erythrobacter sp.]|nr:FixH family protein [Erythrobacter sp.]